MNDESKLPHVIFGAFISWLLTVASWVGDHVGLLAGAMAIVASTATIWAGIETALWRRKQRKDSEL